MCRERAAAVGLYEIVFYFFYRGIILSKLKLLFSLTFCLFLSEERN